MHFDSPQHTMKYIAVLLALLLVEPVWAKYNDTVILKNGDRITGNITALATGQLSFETDAMGTVLIEWDKIAEVISDTPVQVETTGSIRYFGDLEKPSQDKTIVVSSDKETETIPLNEVVHITPISDSFWQRIRGSLSAGFSYTKSSDVAQYNLNLNALYRARHHQVGVKYDSIFTRQDSGTTGQLDSGITYKGFRQKGWFGTGFFSLQSNETLGIDGRGLLGAGIGRALLENSHSTFSLSAGLDLNIEDTTSGSQNSTEAFGTLEYLLYKFQGNQTNLVLEATLFPSLSESGRYRSQFNAKFNYELFTHFFWGFTVYGTSDNKPPEGATAKNDYGVITSVGWTFGP